MNEMLQANVVDCTFGERVRYVSPVNLYGVRLGDDVFVGPFVEIQRGVIISARTRIQSHTFICELVSIGSDCFVGHGVLFTNDRFRHGPSEGQRGDHWEPTVVGNRVRIGSGAVILPVTICSDVVIGAGAVVTHDITQSGTYVGVPARRLMS